MRYISVLLVKIIFIILLIIPGSLISQIDKVNVAVLNFSANGITDYEVITLTNRFRDELVNAKQFRVMEREQMDAVLKEQGFQQTGCTSSECMVEIGQMIGVQKMIGGSIGKVGSTYAVSVRVIDVEKGEVVEAINENYKGEIDKLLTEIMPRMARLVTIPKTSVVPQKLDDFVPAAISLRNKPTSLNEDNVSTVLKSKNLFDKDRNTRGTGIENNYEQQTISGDRIVKDHTTGLMWQQVGSENYMKLQEARAWVTSLNKTNFAGYNNWRLPTLEEAMSLMEREQRSSNLYINPVFDKKQEWIWTSDSVIHMSRMWIVSFSSGRCSDGGGILYSSFYVRAVRLQ